MRNTSKKQEEKRSKRIAKNAKGITLVALVITIIIIIILATVTINMAFGDDGIIKRAEQAADMYANDTAYTDQSMANATASRAQGETWPPSWYRSRMSASVTLGLPNRR